MNENINLVKILRHVPKGTRLWSPVWGAVSFERIVLKFLVNINNIIDTDIITYNNSISITLTLEVP